MPTQIGLLDPIDGDDVISPGELVGGDSVIIYSSCPVYDVALGTPTDQQMGLIQGMSIQASRMVRSIYEVGEIKPILVSAKGSKSMSISSIISEETNILMALYKYMIIWRKELKDAGVITAAQEATLKEYVDLKPKEGMAQKLLRIPYGLTLVFSDGMGEEIQTCILENCMLSTTNSAIEAGTRGVPENSAITWQKTTYTGGDK